MKNSNVKIGLIKWFDKEKGFGLIGTPEDGDYFLHMSNVIKDSYLLIRQTCAVVFNPEFDNKKSKLYAENCRIADKIEDWLVVMNYLGKSVIVNIDYDISVNNRGKHLYAKRETRAVNLLLVSINQIFAKIESEQIVNLTLDYLINNLDNDNFIQYCKLLEIVIVRRFHKTPRSRLRNERTHEDILSQIFKTFGENTTEEIIFNSWKSKKFKYIGKQNIEDFEISEPILQKFLDKINIPELDRIIKYTYGPEFCKAFVISKFERLNNCDKTELIELDSLVKFLDETDQGKQKELISQLLIEITKEEILEKEKKINLTISNYNDFLSVLYEFKELIPKQIAGDVLNKLLYDILKIITIRCTDDLKTKIWKNGLSIDISNENITKFFLDVNTTDDDRVIILSKLSHSHQVELCKSLKLCYDWEYILKLVLRFLKNINSQVFFNGIWDDNLTKDLKGYDLLHSILKYIEDKSPEDEKFNLFCNGFYRNISKDVAKKHIEELNYDSLERIFKLFKSDTSLIFEMLLARTKKESTNDIDWIYNLASKYLDREQYEILDTKVSKIITQDEYLVYWRKGKGKIFPKEYVDKSLSDNYSSYREIERWIESDLILEHEVILLLFEYLKKQEPVSDRKIFYKQINHIIFLLDLDDSYLSKIEQLKNCFYNIALWVLGKKETFEFDHLKSKFIYFNPDDQVKIVRKLFYLKASGQFKLTPEKLNELTRIDFDLYNINLSINPNLSLDISTDIIIKALLSFEENNRFLVEGELLKAVLEDLEDDKTRKFKLSTYFEDCTGRTEAEYNWQMRRGEVKIVDNACIISFDYDSELVDQVKKLPGRRYDAETKCWSLPINCKEAAINFGKEFRFFIDNDGSHYRNNSHLAEFKKMKVPNGIRFCEGRLANKSHDLFNKNFWWCNGQPCFQKCETIHKHEEWEKYNLLDFCEILGFNTDEINRMGEHIPKGKYYQFISLINRFNRLLDKLYCKDCNEILYPSDTAYFAAYNVVRFHCINDKCNNHEEIYLNHCLNGQCNSIIDSRVSKSCPNGLFICENCGSCCSHSFFERRISILDNLDNHDSIKKKWIYNDTKYKYDNKLGHLDRGEYFCYKCGNKMNEISNEKFFCESCKVSYDTINYKFKRPHKYLSVSNNNDNSVS